MWWWFVRLSGCFVRRGLSARPALSEATHAYNRQMKAVHSFLKNSANALALAAASLIVPALMLATWCIAASAQTNVPTLPPTEAQGALPAERPEQSIQRIRTEDAGSRIDEVRVGGQTQSITVQPKIGGNAPPYEVKPSDDAAGAAPTTSRGGSTGSRVWNVLKF